MGNLVTTHIRHAWTGVWCLVVGIRTFVEENWEEWVTWFFVLSGILLWILVAIALAARNHG